MRLIDSENTNLIDAIGRNAFKDRQDIIDLINNQPTVDAVPVVRCRECNQGEVDDPDFPDEYYCHAGCGWNNGDFYCAYGERKN